MWAEGIIFDVIKKIGASVITPTWCHIIHSFWNVPSKNVFETVEFQAEEKFLVLVLKKRNKSAVAASVGSPESSGTSLSRTDIP